MTRRIIPVLALAYLLTACAPYQRSQDAATAKAELIDMSSEDVLACMGIPKKKAHIGETEIWAYPSVAGSSDSQNESEKIGILTSHESFHDKSGCTVDIVMKNGIVTRVNYITASSSPFAPDAECGYAVANCVSSNRF